MGKYRSKQLFLTAIGVMSIFFSAQVVGAATDCFDLTELQLGFPPPKEPNVCFKTPSGYIIETAKFAATHAAGGSVQCLDILNPVSKTYIPVSEFPYKMNAKWNSTDTVPIDVNLWCYQVTAPPPIKGVSINSITQLDLQIPAPYFWPSSSIKMDSSGQVFSYTPANGCSGDSTTGFEVGAVEDCGIKWTYRINPGNGSVRFSFVTKAAGELKNLGIGDLLMGPRVGNTFEPGIIFGPGTSSEFASTGFPYSVCQKHNGVPYYFVKDDFGCTSSVYACNPENPRCDNPGTEFIQDPPVTDPPTYPGINQCFLLKPKSLRMTLKNLATGLEITPPPIGPTKPGLALKSFGFVGGANSCGEGIIRGQGSCVVIIGYDANNNPLTDVRYSYPDCPLPAAPISLAVTAGGDNQVTLRWTDNSTVEDQFKLYRGKNTSTSGGCTGSFSMAPSATITSTSIGGTGTAYTYRWTNLLPSTKYCFKVTARLRDGGESAASNSVCVTCGATGSCAVGN